MLYGASNNFRILHKPVQDSSLFVPAVLDVFNASSPTLLLIIQIFCQTFI